MRYEILFITVYVFFCLLQIRSVQLRLTRVYRLIAPAGCVIDG